MNTPQLGMLARLAAMAALSGTLLGACGASGSAFTRLGASGMAAVAEAKALADAPAEADVPPPIDTHPHPHPLMVEEGEPGMFGATYPWRRNGVDISLMAVIAWLYLAQI